MKELIKFKSINNKVILKLTRNIVPLFPFRVIVIICIYISNYLYFGGLSEMLYNFSVAYKSKKFYSKTIAEL